MVNTIAWLNIGTCVGWLTYFVIRAIARRRINKRYKEKVALEWVLLNQMLQEEMQRSKLEEALIGATTVEEMEALGIVDYLNRYYKG